MNFVAPKVDPNFVFEHLVGFYELNDPQPAFRITPLGAHDTRICLKCNRFFGIMDRNSISQIKDNPAAITLLLKLAFFILNLVD